MISEKPQSLKTLQFAISYNNLLQVDFLSFNQGVWSSNLQ